MNFIRATDGEFYDLDKAIKIVKEKDLYKVTFEVKINLGKNKNDTYINKYFTKLNEKVLQKLVQIDENLFLDFSKIFKISFFKDKNEYCYLTSNSKKRIGTKNLNYNIKVSNKNKLIDDYIKGEGMNWIKIRNTIYNLDNVTNVFIDESQNKVIFNFINSTTNKTNVKDIKPEYEIEYLENVLISLIKERLENLKNFIKVENKYINLDNVYNIKIINSEKIVVFINFISNISKMRNKEKIMSTEFVKCEFKNEEELKKFLSNFNI